jgi:hypothetical protein
MGMEPELNRRWTFRSGTGGEQAARLVQLYKTCWSMWIVEGTSSLPKIGSIPKTGLILLLTLHVPDEFIPMKKRHDSLIPTGSFISITNTLIYLCLDSNYKPREREPKDIPPIQLFSWRWRCGMHILGLGFECRGYDIRKAQIFLFLPGMLCILQLVVE